MRLAQYHNRRKARIEIIPLIDIIFFLLATFVMVSLSMIRNEGISINLPTATSAQPQERKDSVTVSVTKTGEIYLSKEPVTLEDLKLRLAVLKSKDKDPQIFIHGDEDASFKNMMGVLDTVRNLGITKVAMQTEPQAAPVESSK